MSDSLPFAVQIGLAAPRVAVVFNGGQNWHYWARLAIHAASRIWGGRGFLLVPHVDGVVDPLLLAAARTYDPDYVVLLETTFGQWEKAAPNTQPIRIGGRTREGEERARMMRQVADQCVQDAAGAAARQTVAAACSPYRRRLDDGRVRERLTTLGVHKVRSPLTALASVPAAAGSPYLSAPRDWDGALGVIAAAQCGLFEEPEVGSSPDLSDADRWQLLHWLLTKGAASTRPPTDALLGQFLMPFRGGDDPHRAGMAFQRTTLGLGQAGFGYRDQDHLAFVIGDTAADFAAAHARDLLYGDGIWLPSELSPCGTDENVQRMRIMLDTTVVASIVLRRGRVTVSTVSAAPVAVEETVQALRDPDMGCNGSAVREQEDLHAEAVRSGDLAYPRSGALSWAVEDDLDHPAAVPASRDEDGTTTMLSPTPVPDVSAGLLRESVELTWQVEVRPEGTGTPPGRGLAGTYLLAPGENELLTWVRSGRNGIRFESHRYDRITAGTPRLSRLARPRLRELSVIEWARCLTAQQGTTIRLSGAGRRAEVLSRLVGGRAPLAALFAGPMLPVLRGYLSKTGKTSVRYPKKQGVVLHSGGTNDTGYEGYLTFEGMQDFSTRQDETALREDIDDLCTTGLLRRGIIVNCRICSRVSFIALDDAGQTFACPRCRATNPLTSERWREPASGPGWYFDLHPVARDLLRDNGEVPLQLAHYLRSTARSYTDASEFELCGPDGDPIAELDLPAYVDGQVITGEAKCSTTLGKRLSVEVRKKIVLADALQADQILFASTDTWESASLKAIGEHVTRHQWTSGKTPEIRIITELGQPACQDRRLNPRNGRLLNR
ncbi:hypothetical protein [Catenuloplanes japonicus]|uniref:hypothetical protein n=1 Tax=Catenuloplanes japonicus TaxID=33876 RepID=UPI000A87215F|nr:hypothetical protein [Catenuloplanes japonicus]